MKVEGILILFGRGIEISEWAHGLTFQNISVCLFMINGIQIEFVLHLVICDMGTENELSSHHIYQILSQERWILQSVNAGCVK